MERTVFIFGAGATKACGGPQTHDILADALSHPPARSRAAALDKLDQFLCEVFHVKSDLEQRSSTDYPPLPMLLTLVDTAIARREALTPAWTHDRLAQIRAALEYAIFTSLHLRLTQVPHNIYFDLFMAMAPHEAGPTAISMNYDTLADRAMIELSHWAFSGHFPDYGASLQVRGMRGPNRKTFGKLFKLHGSIDWFYCDACKHVAVLPSDLSIYRAVVPRDLIDKVNVEQRYESADATCTRCNGRVGPLMIAPSHRKLYDHGPLGTIWSEAERALAAAERVCIVGYSLPEDDVEVALLLKRSLAHLPPKAITVVEYDERSPKLEEHPVGRRYKMLFGDVAWSTAGFEGWIKQGGLVGLAS